MEDAIPFQDHFQTMVALGRPFELGDSYDYLHDRIVNANHIWDQATLESATRTQHKFEGRHLSMQHSDYVFQSKWELMGLDKHLKVSVMAGIINKFDGASNFLNDCSNQALISQTLVCCVKSREGILDLETLVSQNKVHLPCTGEEKYEATHVVVGAFYGAEIYCVLTHDLNNDEELSMREEFEKSLFKLTTEWKKSLETNQDLTQFKDKFNNQETKQLNKMKCRLYADLIPEAVCDCSIFEAYNQCLILIDNVQDYSKELDLPITVLLCPLEAITNPKETITKQYYDLDVSLLSRYDRVRYNLDRIRAKTDTLRASVNEEHCSRLRRFALAIAKYQKMLKKKVKDAVIEARKTNSIERVERIVDISENHLLFRPSRLKRWLYYEKAEVEMTEQLVVGDGGITFLADWEVMNTAEDKKYVLLLIVPSLNEMYRDVISSLENYVRKKDVEAAVDLDGDDYDQDGDVTEEEEETDGIAFRHVEFRRQLLQSKLRELTEHMKRNEEIEKQIQLFVTNDREIETECCCVLYDYTKSRENPLQTFWFQLPKPPKNLRIDPAEAVGKTKKAKPSTESIRIEWDQPKLKEVEQQENYPFYYVVEYRPKGSTDCWARTNTKTNESHAIIEIDPGAVMEVRVASGCCIGLSEFSQVIFSDSATNTEVDDIETPKIRKQPQLTNELQISSNSPAVESKKTEVLHPPSGVKIGFVTQTTADITWIPSSSKPSFRFSYCVRYRQNEPSFAKLKYFKSSQTSCKLVDLEPGKEYTVDMSIISSDRKSSSASSGFSTFITSSRSFRFAEMLIQQCEIVENQDAEMDFHAVPFSKETVQIGKENTTIQRFVFGEDTQKAKERKTILLVGASDSGKTSLINGMINYIFDVQWKDRFRFQLNEDQTKCVNVYNIHHYEGFNIDYSLTIIDTPGFGENMEKNQEITKAIRHFFEDNDGEQKVNLVGFVMKSSMPFPTEVLNATVSIFGDQINENLIFLLTFANQKEDSPLLNAIASFPGIKVSETDNIRHQKFDSSAFFCSNATLADSSKPDSNDEGVDEGVEEGNKKLRMFHRDAQLAYNNFSWCANCENLCALFMRLNLMTSKSLSSSLKLKKEKKKRIETTLEGIERYIRVGLMKMEELRTINQAVKNQWEQIELNIKFHIDTKQKQKVLMPFGNFATICNTCKFTCHESCGSEKDKANCVVMDHSKSIADRTCLVCPRKCMWNAHTSEPFSWEHFQQQKLLQLLP